MFFLWSCHFVLVLVFYFVSIIAVVILIVVYHGMFDSFGAFMVLSIILSVLIDSHRGGRTLT